jgi:4-amino-4-deoxy-L-arabinose transferase-like glycosyltransferase
MSSTSLNANKTLVVGFLVLFLFGITRLLNLSGFPIFTDEAIYIHWAQLMRSDWNDIFISKMDGKQPLYMWLVALALNFKLDPLITGRCITILASLCSIVGIFYIGKTLFNDRVGFFAVLSWIFFPYLLFFDRLALADGLLTACGVWSVAMAVYIIKNPKSGILPFLFLGGFLGCAYMTKATAFLLVPIPFVFLFLGKKRGERQWIYRSVAALGCAALVALPYFLSQTGVAISDRDLIVHRQDLVLTPNELLSLPWAIWYRNAEIIWEFYCAYITWPILTLLGFAIGSIFLEKNYLGVGVIFWAVFPTLVIVLVAKGFFSRYFIIALPPLTILAAVAFERLGIFISKLIERTSHFGNVSITAKQVAAFCLLFFITFFDGFFLPGNSSKIR